MSNYQFKVALWKKATSTHHSDKIEVVVDALSAGDAMLIAQKLNPGYEATAARLYQ